MILTKISKTLQNITLVLVTGIILFMPAMVIADSLDDLLREQDQLEAEIRRNQAIIDQTGESIKDLENQIAVVNAQIAETQASLSLTYTQIKITEKEIESLEKQIIDQENKLGEQKNILWAGIDVLYKEKDTSLMETILSSENFSDVMNRNFYLSSIEDQVIEAMDEIIALKNKLAENKKDMELKQADLSILAQKQETEKNNLRLDQNAKNTILAQTLGEQSNYKNYLSKLRGEASKLSQDIYDLRREMGGDEGNQSGGTGGYPYASVSDTVCSYSADPWGFCYRQCTSYAAWYWNAKLNKSWHNTRPGSGSAWNWPNLAYDQSYSVSSIPRVGAIVSWGKASGMPYGHVAIVRSVNSNNTIDLSEYNWTT
ncbi:CHAP domain-containing protein, partial [Patescibacteria group bacterium]